MGPKHEKLGFDGPDLVWVPTLALLPTPWMSLKLYKTSWRLVPTWTFLEVVCMVNLINLFIEGNLKLSVEC